MTNLILYIEKNPQESKRLIGLSFEKLESLIIAATQLEKYKRREVISTKKRLIGSGGGRPPKLSRSEQILLTLVYLHHLPTFQMLGIQFGVSESAANYMFHYWIDILRELLPSSLLEQVKKKNQKQNGLRKFSVN